MRVRVFRSRERYFFQFFGKEMSLTGEERVIPNPRGYSGLRELKMDYQLIQKYIGEIEAEFIHSDGTTEKIDLKT